MKLVLFLLIIFVLIFLGFFYKSMNEQNNKKTQLLFYLNNPYYNRNQYNHTNCPRGCSSKTKKCLYPHLCYNSNSNDPLCCIQDEQCNKC